MSRDSGFLSPGAARAIAGRRHARRGARTAGRSRRRRYTRHGLVSRPGEGRAFMNQYLLGIAGIAVILAALPSLLSSNRKAIRLRVVGAAFALQAVIALLVLRHQLGPRGDPGHVGRRRQPARLCEQGHRIPVRPERQQPARQHLRDRRAAGDHLLRQPGRDPLLSRHHAADRPLGRRRDRLGDRDQPGRIAGRRGQHLRRPVGKPAGRAALSRRAAAVAAVHRDDASAWPASPAPSSPLTPACSASTICPTCSPPPSCRRRAAS